MDMKYKSGKKIQEGDLVRCIGPYKNSYFYDRLGLVLKLDIPNVVGYRCARILFIDENIGENIGEITVSDRYLEFVCRDGKKRMAWI